MQIFSEFLSKYKYHLAFLGLGIIYLFNLPLDVMDVDASQYASISREMLENKSFLEVYHRHQDYLDKPPLLFWLSSLSFYLFGISNIAYKLPAVLVILLGVYSTYRFSLMWYSKQKSLLAVLILCSSQALLLITNDIRTDGILLGFVMFSIWQISAYLQNNAFKNLVLAAIGIAAALLSKGPIGLIIPVFALGGHLALSRNWKAIFKPQWLILLVIVGILLLPMCYGLYTQFDLHPEKTAYGLKSPSGLRFFFWTQSFGRITGEIYWDNGTSFFYFFHTILWDFQPWILLFIPALILRFKQLIQDKFKVLNNAEYITLCGFVLGFLALSKSNYKLPHYIFPLFPFASIITANFLVDLSISKPKILAMIARGQFVLMSLFFVILGISYFLFFPPTSLFHPIFWVLSASIFVMVFIKEKDSLTKTVFVSVIAIIFFGINTSTYLYPNLFQYQSTGNAGKYLLKANIPIEKSYFYKEHGHSLDFYAQRIVNEAKIEDISKYPVGSTIFTTLEGAIEIKKKDTHYKVIKGFDEYHITALKLPFLLKSKRATMLKTNVLIQKVS